jgi:hypothetical protein
MPFDSTVSSFRKLARTSLLTLHIDIRCGIIHQLSRTLRGAETLGKAASTPEAQNRDSTAVPSLNSGLYPYVLPFPPSTASPPVLELSNDLIDFDANIASYLGSKEHLFILSGLARLFDRYLVVGADMVGVMNNNGAERMRIDAMVIQQNLRAMLANDGLISHRATGVEGSKSTSDNTGLGIMTTSPAPSSEDDDVTSGLLSLTTRYLDLFLAGPDAVLKYVTDTKAQNKPVDFTYDELRTLLELCFSARLRGEDREMSVKARKRQQEVLLALGERMWDS